MEAVGEGAFKQCCCSYTSGKKKYFYSCVMNQSIFKLQIHCVLNGMIKMDKLIVLLWYHSKYCFL